MQPEQTPAPDYNFILSPQSGQKKSLLGLGGNSPKQRILIVIISGLGLLALFALIFGLIFSSGSDNTERLVRVAQQQQELIRIAEMGQKDAVNPDAQNFSSTVKISTISAHNQLIELLGKHGRKLNSRELSALASSKTDEELTLAKQANQYDETLLEILRSQLKSYQKEIGSIYNNSNSATEREILRSLYDSAVTLLPASSS